MDHDQRFKVLLQAFFREFIQLFFPHWEANIDFPHVTWLDKETFVDPPQGEHRILDMVGRLPVFEAPSDEEPVGEWLLLLHIEIESADRAAPLRRRIFEYRNTLRMRDNLPVLSIGFFLQVQLDGLGWDEYREVVWGEEIVHFRYPYIGLPGLNGEEYITGENVLGMALAVLMRLPEERRLELGEEAWRRIESEPDDRRRYLLRESVVAYLPRNDEERRNFRERLLNAADPGERAMTVHMFDEIRQEGRVEGQRESLLLVLENSFGPLSEETQQRVSAIPAGRLSDALKAVLRAPSLADVVWPE